MAAVGRRFEAENFVTDLQCFFCHEFCKDPVSLVPCMEKVCRVCAERFFGKPLTTGFPNQKQCPSCKEIISGYHFDRTFQRLISTILNRSLDLLLPEVSAIVKKEWEILPYPGKKARFVHQSGDWSYQENPCYVRSLWFGSTVKDSLFNRMNLLGYKDGTVVLSVMAPSTKNHQEILEYFASRDLVISHPSKHLGHYKAEGNPSAKKLFLILAEQIQEDDEWFPLLRKLVESGDWRTVTPLDENVAKKPRNV